MITIMGNPRQYKIPDWFLNRQKDVKDGKYTQVCYMSINFHNLLVYIVGCDKVLFLGLPIVCLSICPFLSGLTGIELWIYCIDFKTGCRTG